MLSWTWLLLSCRDKTDVVVDVEVPADSDTPSDTDPGAPPPTFFEDFEGPLDPQLWKIMRRNWGGQVDGVDYNGGVVPDLVRVEGGMLVLEAHGNLYEGLPLGINKDLSPRADGKRVGAGIATSAYLGSGRYEISARIAPELGLCSSLFSFHYQEFYPGEPGFTGNGPYSVVNHEVDIELPGREALTDYSDIGYDKLLATSWVGERPGEFTPTFADLPHPLDDGAFHRLRYDWHTGGPGETPRVEWYVDGALVATNTTTIPTHMGRLYLAAWFPNTWAGTPDFAVTTFTIDWVSFTAFDEPGDTLVAETYPDDGWAE